MPGKKAAITAPKRTEIAAHLQIAIANEQNAQRKAMIGAAIGALQSNLNGMTNEEAERAIVGFILQYSQPQ